MPAVVELLPLAAIRSRLEDALRRTSADAASISWLEARRESVCEGGRARPGAPAVERTIVVRVREGGRLGESRTGSGEPSDLESAVRLAVASSRVVPAITDWEAPAAASNAEPLPPLYDPQIAELEPDQARRRLGALVAKREVAELDWGEGRLVTAGSLAVECDVQFTAIGLRVRCGRRPGAGGAEDAARTLASFSLEEVLERARQAHGGTGLADLPSGACAAVASPEAAAKLIEGVVLELAAPEPPIRVAKAWRDGFVGAGFELVEAPCGAGLPMPWDLLGRRRRPGPVEVAPVDGAGPWAQKPIGKNLRLVAHRIQPESELLAAASSGLWIGAIGGLEVVPLGNGLVRFAGRGLRRVDDGGRLGDPVPDARFEIGMAELAAGLRGAGERTICRAAADRLWGGVAAPALLLAALPAGAPLPL